MNRLQDIVPMVPQNGHDESVKKQSFRTIVKSLMKNSSLYPVSQVGNEESSSKKIWWIFVLVIGLIGSGYQITLFLIQYFRYPVVVDVNLENVMISKFPAVTICNLNRMKSRFLTCMENNRSFNSCESSSSGSGSSFGSGFKSETPVTLSERRSFGGCHSRFDGESDKHADDSIRFLMDYTTVDSEDRKSAGYTRDKMVMECSFKGQLCKDDAFSYFQSSKYGNCFTFNKKKSGKDIYKVSVMDPDAGLDLVLDLDSGSYLEVTPSIGARIIIHDPDEDPNPEEDGVNVSPGFHTSIRIRSKIMNTLPAPYPDQCVDYATDSTVRGRSRSDCALICQQEQNLAHCSCVDPTIQALSDRKRCNMTSREDNCCLDEVVDLIATEGLPCKCPSMCSATEYITDINTACFHSRLNHYDQYSHASVKVFFSSLQRKVFDQSPMYQNSQLFGNLGSLLGLWLGISLFFLFEIAEKLIVCIRTVLGRT